MEKNTFLEKIFLTNREYLVPVMGMEVSTMLLLPSAWNTMVNFRTEFFSEIGHIKDLLSVLRADSSGKIVTGVLALTFLIGMIMFTLAFVMRKLPIHVMVSAFLAALSVKCIDNILLSYGSLVQRNLGVEKYMTYLLVAMIIVMAWWLRMLVRRFGRKV